MLLPVGHGAAELLAVPLGEVIEVAMMVLVIPFDETIDVYTIVLAPVAVVEEGTLVELVKVTVLTEADGS